jgi:hypothetical protein
MSYVLNLLYAFYTSILLSQAASQKTKKHQKDTAAVVLKAVAPLATVVRPSAKKRLSSGT